MDAAYALVDALRTPTERQWYAAGGCILARPSIKASDSLITASREAFITLQIATALDVEARRLQAELRRLNSSNSITDAVLSPADKSTFLPRQVAAEADKYDDHSDGSAVQGELVSRCVVSGKKEVRVRCDEPQEAPDGTLRLIQRRTIEAADCARLVAAGVVAMAGAFARCGQTTLGVSPALADRLRCCEEKDGVGLGAAVPELYLAIEAARRSVAKAFGKPLQSLRTSDATLTRLLPVSAFESGAERKVSNGVDVRSAATAAGTLDVGAIRSDRFCYWRPHLDKVSVQEYEYSALLYLSDHRAAHTDGVGDDGFGGHSEAGCGDFSGGRLIFHDEDADRVVLPEAGLLVAFTSGAPNLHAVERVTEGVRFALTMWFTSTPDNGTDPDHRAMQDWAVQAADARERAIPPPPPPTRGASIRSRGSHATDTRPEAGIDTNASAGLSVGVSSGFPAPARVLLSREADLASAALCSLPANDPLCSAMLLAHARGGGQVAETLSRGLSIPITAAHATPLIAGDTTDARDPQVVSTDARDPQVVSTDARDPQVVSTDARDPQVVSTDASDPQVAGGSSCTPPRLLQPRIQAYGVLLATCQRARAEHPLKRHRQQAGEGTTAADATADAFSIFDDQQVPANGSGNGSGIVGAQQSPFAPSVSKSSEDAFSVFD